MIRTTGIRNAFKVRMSALPKNPIAVLNILLVAELLEVKIPSLAAD